MCCKPFFRYNFCSNCPNNSRRAIASFVKAELVRGLPLRNRFHAGFSQSSLHIHNVFLLSGHALTFWDCLFGHASLLHYSFASVAARLGFHVRSHCLENYLWHFSFVCRHCFVQMFHSAHMSIQMCVLKSNMWSLCALLRSSCRSRVFWIYWNWF